MCWLYKQRNLWMNKWVLIREEVKWGNLWQDMELDLVLESRCNFCNLRIWEKNERLSKVNGLGDEDGDRIKSGEERRAGQGCSWAGRGEGNEEKTLVQLQGSYETQWEKWCMLAREYMIKDDKWWVEGCNDNPFKNVLKQKKKWGTLSEWNMGRQKKLWAAWSRT